MVDPVPPTSLIIGNIISPEDTPAAVIVVSSILTNLALWSFFVAQKEVRGKMDNLLKNNKSRLNVNVDMMTDEEKALYISGYGKRINEMKTASISTGCLGGVGGWLLFAMAAASGP